MIGKSQSDKRPVPSAEALEVLEGRKDDGELGYEQKLAYEHIKKFSTISTEEAKKMAKELMEYGVGEATAIKIVDIIGVGEVLDLQAQAKQVQLPDDVAAYITRIVNATRNDIHVVMGGSPRADIAFMQCGKAKALLEGRNQVSREDIRFLAKPVLSHRIAVRSTGGIGVHGIVDGILATLG